MTSGKTQILYVDDDPALLNNGKIFLEKNSGFVVRTLESALEALAFLKDHPVDAIISDYQMPEMDGVEFLKAVRARGDKTPFIIFTGRGREEVVIEALNSGADFYLQKGGEPKTQFAELKSKIEQAIRRRQAEPALVESEEIHRLVLEFAGISSTLWTTDGHLLMINRYGAANLGGVPKDFIGKTMAVLFGPEAAAVYLERIQQAAAAGTRMEFEDRVPLPEGDRWFLSAHTCITDAPGQAKRVMIFSHDITRRKIAEQAQRDSREKLAFAIEGAHLGLWDINYTNRTIRHNRYWHELLGNDSEETVTLLDSWKTTIHPDDLPRIETITYDHLAGKTPVLDMEYRIRHKDGSWLWIHTIGKVVSRSADGKPLRMSGINQDITEQKQADETIRRSKEFLNKIIDTIGDPIYVKDREHRLVLINDAACAIFGHSRDEMLGQTGYDLFPTREMADRSFERDEEVFLTGKDSISEEINTYSPGKILTVLVRKSRYVDENQNQFLVGISVDITDRKRTEKELTENRDRLNFAIQGAHIGTWDLDRAKGTITHNVRWNEMLGYAGEETTTKADWWLGQIHPDDVSSVQDRSQAHVTGKTPVLDMTYRMKKADGTWVWVRTIGRAIERDKKGIALRMSGINQDVTELKLAEITILEREEKFREIFNKANDAIHLHEIEADGRPGRFIDVNDVACQMLQYSRDEMLQHGPLDFATNYHSRPVDKIFEELRTVGHATFETGHRRKDGTIVPVEVNAHKITLLGRTVVLSVVRDITERKRAEEALRESEEWYREFFTTSRDCVFITTPEGRWIDFNDVALDLLGYSTREELAAVPIPDLYENAGIRNEFNAIIVRDGYAEDHPVRLKKKDGTIIDTLVTSVPLKADDGSVKAFFGTIRDVTEKKRADEEIRTLQQFQQSIIDNANVWISVLDTKGTIRVWNTTAEQISGYPAADVIGKNTVWKQLYPDPVYRKQVVKNILDIIKKNTYIENFETRIRTKGNDEKIIWWNTQPLRDASGTPVQFIAIGRDNTERIQAEERINALRQFEESVIKNANIWISVLDGKGNVSVWNRAAEEISGHPADEVIGKNTIWSRMYPDKDYRRTVTAKIKEIIGAHKYLENFETRIRTKDGQERIIWWNTRTLQDVPGIGETFIAIGKDVTEQKTLSDAVQLANKKLNLLSNITRHDIVNQLSALNGYLELSRDILGDPVKLEEYITKEQTIASTMETQILFTKDYQDMGIKAPEWQNVHKNVDMAISNLPLRGITVETDSPSLEVYADPLLVRVFYNLIDNALRYGGEQMTAIRISSQESSRGLLVVCEDDGVGVPAGKKEAIFTRGYFKHTGFGLFLSREILSITGITIAETGEPGKGARFEITVPKGDYRFVGTGGK